MQDFHPDVSLFADRQYLYQVRHTSPLTPSEETKLLQALPTGGTKTMQARNTLVEMYQPLVLSIAKRYASQGYALDLMDLVQEGNLGLLDAIAHYDPKHPETAFSTWSFTWIRGAILRALWQAEHMIRLPARKVRLLRQYEEVHTQLCLELDHEPSLREFALALGISLPEMRELQELYRQHDRLLSLDMVFDDGTSDGATLADTIAAPSPIPNATTRAFYQAWAQLPHRERLVMTLRLGLEDRQPLTQQQVAYALGVSLQTVEVTDRRARLRLERLLQLAGVLKQDEALALPA